MAEIDFSFAPGMDTRLWVVGTPSGCAAFSLDTWSIEIESHPQWGDKIDLKTEGIISLAAGPSVQEMVRRFHQVTISERFSHGSYKIMRQLYRTAPYVYSQIGPRLTAFKKERGVIWRPSDLNPTNILHKRLLQLNGVTTEERDGENVLLIGAM